MVWEETSEICWLAASIETAGVILNTYHVHVHLHVENFARIPTHMEPCIEFLQVQCTCISHFLKFGLSCAAYLGKAV